MSSRRDFIKRASVLSGAAGAFTVLPPSILKALAIDPVAGSTYLDAEHIVVLMQENRSFDHCFGALKGVRGFNDPRAITLPNDNPVWYQTNAAGETYTPFRLRIKETKSTWLGSLPHSWTNQVDAGNNGKHNKWLDAKPSGRKGYTDMPLTMGYYNREDIPFYYAMADAFTVCDQNFSSALTGTTPNRLYLWSGTVRAEQRASSPAKVRNEDVDYTREVSWKTFPERLEDHEISWKIYQNELSLASGLEGEEDAWLSNFTDNPIEWFAQFNVRYSAAHMGFMKKLEADLPGQIKGLEQKIQSVVAEGASKELSEQLIKKKALLKLVTEETVKWTPENYEQLSAYQKNLHQKAFTTNKNDPAYRKLKTVSYTDGDQQREIKVPAGDTLHQFRSDVRAGKLPTVSWIVSPENFSDHPGAPWYGAWYISEVMDILTENPETWKKTIFILCYDENDGYFDHVPPFTPPIPGDLNSGKVSSGIDPAIDYVTYEQDKQGREDKNARESPIGLGYRVPLVIASPWSRGGAVCSEVFDHTSILQFMETFLTHRTGKQIKESNISNWRRTICGDLTSVFKPYNGETLPLPVFPEKSKFMQSIHKAQFQKDPFGFQKLTNKEIEQIIKDPALNPILNHQESGIRMSRSLPYELYVDGYVNSKNKLEIRFEAGDKNFGKKSAGSPFLLYDKERNKRSYAVAAGDKLMEELEIDNNYRFDIYGPNGFFRSFKGSKPDPRLNISLDYLINHTTKIAYGNIRLLFDLNNEAGTYQIEISDNSYKSKPIAIVLDPNISNGKKDLVIDLQNSSGWYDLTVNVKGIAGFERSFAGRVENGREGLSDPAMA